MSEDWPGGASEAEARDLAAAFRALVAWAHAPENLGERNEVTALVRDVLGEAGEAQSVVTRRLPPFEHVNLQTALGAWSAEAGRRGEGPGIAMPPHYGGGQLPPLGRRGGPPPPPAPPPG